MDELEHFKSKYRAHVQEGHRRYAVPKRISMDPLSPGHEPFDLSFEYEHGVQIDMSQRDFEHLVHMEKHFFDTMNRSGPYIGDHAKMIVDEYEREQRIRNNNPGIRKAYEKYKIMLSMVDSYYD